MVMGLEEALGKARPAMRKGKCGLNLEMWATGVQNLNRNKFRKGGDREGRSLPEINSGGMTKMRSRGCGCARAWRRKFTRAFARC